MQRGSADVRLLVADEHQQRRLRRPLLRQQQPAQGRPAPLRQQIQQMQMGLQQLSQENQELKSGAQVDMAKVQAGA